MRRFFLVNTTLTKGEKAAKLKPWGGANYDLVLQEEKGHTSTKKRSKGAAEKREERHAYSAAHG